MSNYVVSLPSSVSPGNYLIGDGGILVRVKEDDGGGGGGGEKRVLSQQLLACGYCMATFTAKEALARHVVDCEAEKKKKIKVRNGTEESVRVLCPPSSSQSDVRVGQQAAEKVTCPRKGCVHKFAPSELESHLSCHVAGEGNTFACPECGAEFGKWRPLAAHLWKSHSVSVGLTSCPVCHEFKALVPSALREHLLVHSDDRDAVPCCREFPLLELHGVLNLLCDAGLPAYSDRH